MCAECNRKSRWTDISSVAGKRCLSGLIFQRISIQSGREGSTIRGVVVPIVCIFAKNIGEHCVIQHGVWRIGIERFALLEVQTEVSFSRNYVQKYFVLSWFTARCRLGSAVYDPIVSRISHE